ncbi:VPA1262 family protein [Shewanella baltica]|uniref:VPA1262 family protein n=1 Tax=Shewanella baltica TaxID=62322 RepID=UPI003218451B
MSYQLTDLLNDCRLDRLFSSEKYPCALQLWVLQLQYENAVENRVLYGRLLPYSFSTNSWSFSHKNDSKSFGSFRASVTRLNLYVDSSICRELLSMACDRQSIDNISEKLNIKLPENIRERFGNTIVVDDRAIFRPITYLLNSDAHLKDSLASPHGSAGALSASISKSDKQSLFLCGEKYDTAFTTMIVEQLNTDTGMSFGSKDIARLGDIELLVFPTLDDNERNLLEVNWNKDKDLNVRFTSTQLPTFNRFQFHLTVENDNQVLCSRVAVAKFIKERIFECSFKLEELLFDIADSAKIDIFSFTDDYEEGCLCCSWKTNYVREINFQMQLVGNSTSPVKFDWLEKTTIPKMANRVSQALSFSARENLSQNRISGREIDKWVPENQALKSLFSKLYPPKSEGRFFPRWGQSNGEGRLQFVEWFQCLMKKNQQQHIAIFDPYFEDVGLSLLTLYALPDSEYTIFRSIPKPRGEDIPRRRKTDNMVSTGIDNLIANCERNRRLLQRCKVKIYGLKEERLHDRYILVIGKNGLPVEGFHLSNSFQKAAENYPLLITPIPTDVLYKTNQYTFEIIQEARSSPNEQVDQGSVSILFDSTVSNSKTKLYEPLSILKHECSGTVLSVWFKQPLLKELFGNELKDKLAELGILQSESLNGLSKTGLFNCLKEMDGELSDFIVAWEVIGDILAHTPIDDSNIGEFQSDIRFLSFLSEFLSCAFQRETNCDEHEISVIDPSYFKKSLTEFIHSSTQIHHFLQSTKYRILTWAEFYAVKYLWRYSPESLIFLIERESKLLTKEYQPTEAVRLSLLGQSVSEISLSLEFHDISDKQQEKLIESDIALLNWFGWNSLEQLLLSSTEFELAEGKLLGFSYTEKIQYIGWALNRNANIPNSRSFYDNLIVQLQKLLPEQVSFNALELLIDSSRGHMHYLGWAEPWLFSDVVEPILRKNRVNFEDVCEIWFRDLIDLLNNENPHRSLLFSPEREGKTTNLSSYLWAHSNPSYQKKCIGITRKVLNKQKRIIQQPLASTSNWSRWDEALKVSLWILVFAKLSRYYLNTLNILHHEDLDSLLEDSFSLAMVRASTEWMPHSELFSYLEKVEELLNEHDGK